MLSITLLFTSLLAGFTVAQNSTFNANSVDLTTRNQWCLGEKNNCPLLCGGPTNWEKNDCDGATLQYNCICKNGTGPTNIADYLDTLPNSICNRQFADCRQANPGSQECKSCGTLKPTDVKMVAASTSAAASTSGAMTSSAPAMAPSATKAGNAGRKVEGAMGGLAAGVIAAVLL